MRLEDGNDSNLPGGISFLIMKLIIGLLGLAFLAACETTTITPTASMKPALADRLAVLNTDEPMPPAEGPEDVAPGPARDPTRNPGLVLPRFCGIRRRQSRPDERCNLRIESTSARICDSACAAVSVIRRRAEPRATLG